MLWQWLVTGAITGKTGQRLGLSALALIATGYYRMWMVLWISWAAGLVD